MEDDPKLRRWCGLAFNADGSYDISIHGPRMLKAKYGKSFNTRMKGARADGLLLTGSWTTTLIDENTYQVKVYESDGDKRNLMLAIRLERKEE